MKLQASALSPTRWSLAISKGFASSLLLGTVLTFPNSGAARRQGRSQFLDSGVLRKSRCLTPPTRMVGCEHFLSYVAGRRR